jgi:putative phage-type endonuclease
MSVKHPEDRESWLEARRSGIGASDAACIMGLNPWKTNHDLWMEKTGRKSPEDISDSPVVQYGNDAEPLLRELFALDFPEYTVYYDAFGMFSQPAYPWLFATLDGYFTMPDGRWGVLEIKTTQIMRSRQWQYWKDRIPDHYYIQVLHQLLATGFDLAILKAQIKSESHGQLKLSTRHFAIDRDDEQVQQDMKTLLDAEIAFWQSIVDDQEPGTKLPEI